MAGPGLETQEPLAIRGGAPARAEPIVTWVEISERAREQVAELLETGRLSTYYGGPWARKFETSFAAYHGAGHAALAVNSGTSALHLAITAAGIGPGDEVIIPALCFVAAATAVIQNSAVPVICDAEPKSLTMDPSHVEALITSRTKAVLAVHFWGYAADSRRLRAICDRHGIVLIEDGAQALGARIGEKRIGTFGTYGTSAFSTRKHIQCGEGGMVLSSQADHEHLRVLSNYGKGPGWDDYDCLGYSYRMGEFPAIIGLDGLGRLEAEIESRQAAGNLYREGLAGTGLKVVAEPSWSDSVFFKCPVQVPVGFEDRRQSLIDAISAENVSCRAPHRPLFNVPWLIEYLDAQGRACAEEDCPVVASVYRRLIEIETGPHLPQVEAETTLGAVQKVWRYI